jgi:hypothetical protein
MSPELIGFELGKQTGCLFDDKIAINISPSLAQELNEHFRRVALKTESYGEQGLARTNADFFDGVYRSWEAARRNKV